MKKSWYWAIPITVTFIVGYFWEGVGAAEINSTTGYDVFFRLLTILLSLLVGAGALLYLVIRREVTEKVRDDIKKQFSKIEAKIEINLGLMHFYEGLYEDAIKSTKRALEEKDIEEIDKIWAKNNLAYYYAAKHTGYHPSKSLKAHLQTENKKQAIKLAEFIYRKYDPLIEKHNRPAWAETCAFVKARFAQTLKEKREAREFIHTLLPRRDLQRYKTKLEESLDFLSR